MAKSKLKWRVSEPWTGPYSSFHKRGWPTAELDGEIAFALYCDDAYVPADVKTGNHREITIHVADRRVEGPGFKWRVMKNKANTLAEAKAIAQAFADDHPEVFVKSAE